MPERRTCGGTALVEELGLDSILMTPPFYVLYFDLVRSKASPRAVSIIKRRKKL
ncbi:hypothetical protein Fmac_000394 [Flemingia macrophylla]|uniref:Uncharacterized protein n=1 Tax=Flemingia macrophylla TaxID=520843 RepID=A0ABD1NE53_9FABA